MVKIFKRLLTYSYRYKGRLIAGIFLSFLVAVFNGASLTSMVPIFDSMGNSSSYRFQLSMTKRDLQILDKKKLEPNLRTIEFIEWKIANSKVKLNNHFASLSADQIVLLFVSLVFPIYILKLICLGGAVYFINSTGSMAIRDLRFEIYQKVQTLPLNFFVKEKTGILMSRIINDVDSIGKVISGDLKDAILGLGNAITSVGDALRDRLGNALGESFSALGSALANGENAVLAFGKTFVSVMLDAVNSALQLLLVEMVTKSLIDGSGPIGTILAVSLGIAAVSFLKSKMDTVKLAQGGLAFGPTLATVGDNRGASYDPEVIAPLSKLKSMLGDVGGGNPYVLTTRVAGSDLLVIMEKARNINTRIR
jgi:ABC-type multidrug transport system fused ATPase/permease subunit